MTAVLLVMLVAVGHGFGLLSPLYLMFGEAAQASEDEKYQYIIPTDLGCEAL